MLSRRVLTVVYLTLSGLVLLAACSNDVAAPSAIFAPTLVATLPPAEQPTPVPTPTPIRTPSVTATPTPPPTPSLIPPTSNPTPTPAPEPTTMSSPTPTATPWPTPTPVPPTPTAVTSLTPSPAPTEEGPITTPTLSPTKGAPTSMNARPTPAVKPTTLAPVVEFSSSTSYAPFSEILQSGFSHALNSEFRSTRPNMGISAAVYQDGKLWSESAGMASDSTPMTTATPIGVKSSSKTFLAALILSQIEDGLYGLDDRVSALLKTHRGYQALDKSLIPDATVEQLLTQTSGVAEDVPTGFKAFQVMMDSNWEPSDFFSLIQDSPNQPGTFKYAGPNSYLLGMIAEHRGGNRLNALYQERLLEPLSIQAVLLPRVEIPPGMASPYDDRSGYGGSSGFGDLTQIPMFSKVNFIKADARLSWASAGIVSTPENMARWAYELFSPEGSAVSPGVRTQLTNSFREATINLGGAPQKYGYHIALKQHLLSDGSYVTTYGHPGGGGGYASALFYSPSLDLAISILTNSDLGYLLGTCASRSENWPNPFDCITRDFFGTVLGQ